ARWGCRPPSAPSTWPSPLSPPPFPAFRARSIVAAGPARSGPARGALAGCGDEAVEDARLLARLGMPLHADREPVVAGLDGLHDAVLVAGDGAEAGMLGHGLVMVAVHLQPLGQQPAQAGVLVDLDLGDAVALRGAAVPLVPDDVGQVLHE